MNDLPCLPSHLTELQRAAILHRGSPPPIPNAGDTSAMTGGMNR